MFSELPNEEIIPKYRGLTVGNLKFTKKRKAPKKGKVIQKEQKKQRIVSEEQGSSDQDIVIIESHRQQRIGGSERGSRGRSEDRESRRDSHTEDSLGSQENQERETHEERDFQEGDDTEVHDEGHQYLVNEEEVPSPRREEVPSPRREIAITQAGTSQPGTSQPSTSDAGTNVPPFPYLKPYVLRELESESESEENIDPSLADSSELSGSRGLRKKCWKKIQGHAPWTRETAWTIIENGVEREMTLEEKLDSCKNVDEFNEVFHNDVASRVYDGFGTAGSWERLLRHNGRVLTTLLTKNNSFLAKAQAEKKAASDAQKAITNLTKEVEKWQKKFGEKQMELHTLQTDHTELQIRASGDGLKINQLMKRVQDLETELSDSRKECSEEKAKVGNLKIDKDNLLKEVNELRTQNTNYESEVEDLKKKLDEARASAEEWEDSYKSLDKTNSLLEADIQRAEDTKNELIESLPDERASHLAEFLRSDAFAKASLYANKANILKFMYRAVQQIGVVKGFTPEEFGMANPVPGILNLSSGEWDQEADAFVIKGARIGNISFPELLIRDPAASGSESQGGSREK